MSTETKGELKFIPLKNIRENPVALRQVNKTSQEYKEIVDSMRVEGVTTPISVRPMTDPDTGETYYSLIDGLHRKTCAAEAGLTEIPAYIRSASDQQVLYLQIISNLQKVETPKAAYAKQLLQILSHDNTLTVATLAAKLGKSITWLNDMLSLTKLDKGIQTLVDEGTITASNAFVLAKLPVEEQPNFVERAQTLTPPAFADVVQKRKTEINKARRRGEEVGEESFVAPQHLRKTVEIKAEFEAAKVGPALVRTQLDLDALTTKGAVAEAAFALAVKWVLHQDPASVDAALVKDNTRKAAEAAAKDKAKKASVESRAADAAVKAARLQIEAQAVKDGKSDDEMKELLKNFDDANGLVDGKKPKAEKAAEPAAS